VIAKLEVVAIGAHTPVGLVAPSTAAAVMAGIGAASECPLAAVDADGEPKMVAAVPTFDFEKEGVDRLIPLVRRVIDEVMNQIDPPVSRVPIEVVLVLPCERPGMPDGALDALASRLIDTEWTVSRAANVTVTVSDRGKGCAGVAAVIHHLANRNASRLDEVLTLIVGADSHLHPATLLWLEHARSFGSEARNAIVPGEGAGCIALASVRLRERLALPSLARVAGVGLAQETTSLDDTAGAFGVGLSRAIEDAIDRLSIPDEAIDTIYSDMNGERHRSEEWGFVAMRVPAVFRTLECETPASSWGDTGAASMILGAVLAVRSWSSGQARGPRALVLGSDDGGARGAILIVDSQGHSL